MSASEVNTVESAAETPVVLVRQPHGGALLSGGREGNNGGRPPSAIRKLMSEALADRVPKLIALADNAERDADKLRAMDLLARYGIGTLKEVSTDDVRQKNYALKLTLFAAEFLTDEQRVRLWRRLTKAYASGEKCTSDPDPSEVPA